VPKVSESHLASRRRQILEAAQRCFAREGFHRTTMQDVVREAGLSPGAIYRYFPSKAELVAAIADERHQREAALLEASARGGNAPDDLRRAMQRFFESLAEAAERETRRVGIQVWAEALRDPHVLRVVRRGVDLPRARLATLVRSGQTRGELRPDLDADALARAMIALFHGFVLQQAWDPGVRVGSYLEVLDALLDGLRPRRTGRRAAGRGSKRADKHDTSDR
jgi:AcrR family transcriptional regulator